MIIRGITQTQFFHIPFSWDRIQKIYCTYSQNGQIVLEKDIDNMKYDYDRDCVALNLSQSDTLSFNKVGIPSVPEKSLIYFQLRVLLKDGNAYASVPIKDRVYDVLKNGVIGSTAPAQGCYGHNHNHPHYCEEDVRQVSYTPTFAEQQVDYFKVDFIDGQSCCGNKPGRPPAEVPDDTIIYDGGGVIGYH